MSKIKSFYNNNIQTTKGKIILLVILLAAIYMPYRLYIWMNTQSTDNAYLESDIVMIMPEVNGKIERVNFNENQLVKKNDILFVIEQDQYIAKFNKAKAQLEAAEKELEIAKNEFLNSKDSLKVATIALDNAEKDLKRAKALNKDHFNSKNKLDDAVLGKEKAFADFNKAKYGLKNMEHKISMLEAKLDSAIWEFEGQDGYDGEAKFALDRTIVRAPFDGYVAKSSAKVGAYARPGLPLLYMVPYDDFYVKANFKETQISKFEKNMKAEIIFDGLKNVVFEGKIKSIYPATGSKFALIPTDSATGNFTKIVQKRPVLLDVNIPEEYRSKVAAGYSANVSIRIDQ